MVLLTSTTDVTEEVAKQVTEGVKELNQFTQYIQDKVPSIIAFGLKVLFALIFFFIGRLIIKWIRKLVRLSLERSTADKGVEQFVDSLLKFSLYALLLVMILTSFGVATSSIAALLASGGVAIGLALQGSLSNFAGGVLILILKPFVVGDYIIEDAHGQEGTVKEIQIFYTKLSTLDNKTIVIPNGTLANTSLTNVTDKEFRLLDLKVDISYEADLRKAKNLIETLIKKDDSILQEKDILVFVDNLGASSVVIGARAWVKTEEYWAIRWRLLEEIKLTMDREGIEIPYQQLTVHLENGQE